jgi:signal transduction histidine kinase
MIRKIFGFVSHVLFALRFRLLLLVLLTCTPLVILTLRNASEDRRREVAKWRERTQHMAFVATQEENKLIGETRQLLLALAESSPAHSLNPYGCKRLLEKEFATYSRYANLGIIKTNGEVLASVNPSAGLATPDDRELFQRVLRTRAFSIANFPGARNGGQPKVNFGYPIIGRAGEVRGVVFAALDIDWYGRFGSELPAQLPKGATWVEVDQNGTMLFRFPSRTGWIGQPLPERAVLRQALTGGRGMVETLDAEGIPSFYGFTTIRSQLVSGNVMAILSISKQVLFADADHALAVNLLWLGIASGLGIFLGLMGSNLLVLRPIRALVSSTGRLAAGDLNARTGLPRLWGELGRLTRTFDHMARTLEHREEERDRASRKLRVLSQRLVEVQEAERNHIARELHDEIGQSLTVAEMNLQAMLRSPGNAQARRRLEESIQAVEIVSRQVHDLSLSLRPSLLDDLGLEPALRWYTQRQAAVAGFEVRFRADPLERRLDPIVETECFRIAQEALTNITRHAQASAVVVELRREDAQLRLSVRDDGIGFDVAERRAAAIRGTSLGLLSMEERATLAGGRLEYRSVPGQGTEICAWFPLKWRVEAEDPGHITEIS